MKWLLALLLVAAIGYAAASVPPRTAARVAVRGIRATWAWLAALGPQQPPPARRSWRKAQLAAKSTPRTSREGIVKQPSRERIDERDRAALHALVAR